MPIDLTVQKAETFEPPEGLAVFLGMKDQYGVVVFSYRRYDCGSEDFVDAQVTLNAHHLRAFMRDRLLGQPSTLHNCRGYVRLEQLQKNRFRVEIHGGGAVGCRYVTSNAYLSDVALRLLSEYAEGSRRPNPAPEPV